MKPGQRRSLAPAAWMLCLAIASAGRDPLAAAAESTAPRLPWEREAPLKQAARSTTVRGTLDPRQPTERSNAIGLSLNNPQVRSYLWGPADRVTISIIKNDVWDRRYGVAPTLKLEEIRAGVFSPANKDFDDMPPNQRRPVRGYLPPEGGGRVDRYACWNAYPFPCQKPVGQIILGLDELTGVANSQLTQSCADGVMRFQLQNDRARADLEVLLSMTRNVYAIRGRLAGVAAPWLRLYRHEDQAWRRYMTEDKKGFRSRTPGAASGAMAVGEVRPTQIAFDYAKDAAWNGPVEPPRSGTDGRYFWIHQRFPPEKTFPKGFDYVLMGLVAGPGKSRIQTVDGKPGLGTPPFGIRGDVLSRLENGYQAIRAAPGSAATASWPTAADGTATVYVTVVTCNDAVDPMAEARRRLDAAVADGFDKLVVENTDWYNHLYDQRENGRIFIGDAGATASDSIPEVFQSWYCQHGGGTKPDMRRYEATAYYANVEQDWQLWHSLPCYNEPFYTGTVVRNRADSLDMWWKLVEAWRPAARANAREVYGAKEGMALVHGYLPPVKADRYVHSNVALEYCIDTLAQVVKVLWEEWDYGGDPEFLKQKAYPALRDTALFYANYAQKGEDGCYHFVPSVEAEAWGLFPEFKRARDCISALCMARWAFRRAAEASEVLGLDADLRQQWLEIERKLAPYPTYETKSGTIFNTVAGTVPSWKQGDHWFIGNYPTTLADEINLDSSAAQRVLMLRTATEIRTPRDSMTLVLLGVEPQSQGMGEPTPPEDAARLGAELRRYPERLLNSRSGRIHLFPDTPPRAVVAFRRFQARGGFLVSAVKDERGVSHVEIEPRRDGRCQVMNPWPGSRVVVQEQAGHAGVGFTMDRSNGECLVIPVRKGISYVIQREEKP